MKFLIKLSILVIIAVMLYSCAETMDKNDFEVIARDFRFEVVEEIPSGWNTFEFKNAGHAEHFFLLNLLPDTISFNTYLNEVTRPFEMVFDSIKDGKSRDEAITMLVESIPVWYFTSVKQMGGTGIVSSGMTTYVTLNLVPGTYAMECYIKEQGVFHTALGMICPITVTKDSSHMSPPESDLDITLTNYKIDLKGEIKSGLNTIAVHFNEHPEIGLGNDVHLIKLDENTDMDEVIHWLDWMNVVGLQSPAPVEFLGGTQEMPVGYTSYFSVDLKPGKYAWISESTASLGMISRFTVE